MVCVCKILILQIVLGLQLSLVFDKSFWQLLTKMVKWICIMRELFEAESDIFKLLFGCYSNQCVMFVSVFVRIA